MRRFGLKQTGFGVVGVLIVVVVIAVVGFGAYQVMNMNKASTDSTDAAIQEQIVEPETINTKADLQATEKSLDASSSELDSSLDDSSLQSLIMTML